MEKKLYIVSIHSHGGSFWEASGTHHLVELTEKEHKRLAEKYQYKEIGPERFVCITPIEEIYTAPEILDVIMTDIKEHEYEDDEDDNNETVHESIT